MLHCAPGERCEFWNPWAPCQKLDGSSRPCHLAWANAPISDGEVLNVLRCFLHCLMCSKVQLVDANYANCWLQDVAGQFGRLEVPRCSPHKIRRYFTVAKARCSHHEDRNSTARRRVLCKICSNDCGHEVPWASWSCWKDQCCVPPQTEARAL